jgi:pyruvate-ferredoxin/flavodoxin oxidoreductase
MVKGIFDEMEQARPRAHFTIGIQDDVTHTSLAYDAAFSTEDPAAVRAIFYGLGSDGTVGANKNSIKIIGEQTDNYAQGYFVPTQEVGSVTISTSASDHTPYAPHLISRARGLPSSSSSWSASTCCAGGQGRLLVNSPYDADAVWDHFPRTVQRQIIDKRMRVFVIDGNRVAREAGMGGRVNTVMQACFFAISGVLPREEAIAAIKHAIEKSYGRRGAGVVRRNWEAVDAALEHLAEVAVPST